MWWLWQISSEQECKNHTYGFAIVALAASTCTLNGSQVCPRSRSGCTSALVHWCIGELVHWCIGALVRWCIGARDVRLHGECWRHPAPPADWEDVTTELRYCILYIIYHILYTYIVRHLAPTGSLGVDALVLIGLIAWQLETSKKEERHAMIPTCTYLVPLFLGHSRFTSNVTMPWQHSCAPT